MSQELRYDITADADEFAAGTRKVTSEMNRVGDVAGGINKKLEEGFREVTNRLMGMVGAQALVERGMRQIEEAQNIRDESLATGLSIERYQELGYVASQTASKIMDYRTAIKAVADNQVNALQGNKDITASFQRFGVSVDDLRKKSPVQLFELMAEKQKGAERSALLVSDAINIMGGAGNKVLPGMIQGFDELTKQARDAGAVISEEIVMKLAEVQERFEAMGKSGQSAFAPLLIALANFTQNIFRYIEVFRTFVGTFSKEFINNGLKGMDANSAMANASRVTDEALNKLFNGWQAQDAAFQKALADRRKVDREGGGVPILKKDKVEESKINLGASADSVDALTRIGAVNVGSQVNPTLELMRQQTQIMTQLKTQVDAVAGRMWKLVPG